MVLRTINNKLILLEFLQIVLQIILLDFKKLFYEQFTQIGTE